LPPEIQREDLHLRKGLSSVNQQIEDRADDEAERDIFSIPMPGRSINGFPMIEYAARKER